jgi:hypothetical protein
MSGVFTAARSAFFNANYGWKTTHFWGPIANWGIALAGVYDMTQKDASVISVPMTSTLAVYSLAFMRFAWRVSPRNYILLACHIFNEGVQLTQLYRRHEYDKTHKSEQDVVKSAFCASVVATGLFVPKLQRYVLTRGWIPEKTKNLLNHPAGPFTIFFWAPTMKWALSIANLIDYKRPVEKLSIPQQCALAITGVIWTRWSFVITPVNYNLAAVNAALAATGMYHIMRKTVYDPFKEE